MSHEEWQQQLEDERYDLTLKALQRCKQAGADQEDIQTLARECGVDIRFIEKE